MGQYQKKEGNKYYLKKLNSNTGELEWIEIILESSRELKEVNWDNIGYFE
jgi:hypothetical protein